MTKLPSLSSNPRRLVLFGLAAGAAQVAGCGGGGGGLAGIGSGGTGSFTTGVITGLGSIIVNGVRYTDDTAEKIAADDSTARALIPGMVVAIEGSAVTPSTTGGLPTATAYRIVYGSEWKGPVSSVDTVNKRFSILNQSVDVLATTAFVGAVSQLSNLVAGTHYVEVYGFVDPSTSRLQASFIEVKTERPSVYKLSGSITNINTTTRTAQFGAAANPIGISWDLNARLPDGFSAASNGSFVRLVFDAAGVSGANYPVTRIRFPSSPLSDLSRHDDYEAEIEGTVTSFTSSTVFSVNGIAVNASSATSTGGPLQAGSRVEVKGRIVNAQMLATRIEIKSARSDEAEDFEFHGSIVSVGTGSFTLRPKNASDSSRDQTFTYDANTQYDDGLTSASLTVSARVYEVKAVLAGSAYRATEVKLDD